MANQEREMIVLLDGNRDVERVFEDILKVLRERFGLDI